MEHHPHADDRLLRALGLVATQWSNVELISGAFLMLALGGSHDIRVTQAVVAGQPVNSIWDATEAILQSRGEEFDDVFQGFREWRKGANRHRLRRNEVIHGAWMLGAGGELQILDMVSRRARSGSRTHVFSKGAAELEELAHDIVVCNNSIGRLQFQLETAFVRKHRESQRQDRQQPPDRPLA